MTRPVNPKPNDPFADTVYRVWGNPKLARLALGVSATTMSRWMTGKVNPPAWVVHKALREGMR